MATAEPIHRPKKYRKAVAARNAFTGVRRAELRRIVKDMNQALREHREWLGAR